MMKRFVYVGLSLAAVFILIGFAVTSGASAGTNNRNTAPIIPETRQLPRLVDDANLLKPKEEEKLLALLNKISEQQECDVAVITVPSLDGKTSLDFAHDFYDYNGYGYGEDDSGILFLLCPEERDWAISTYGFGIPAFTDAGQEFLMDIVKPSLSSESFYKAFTYFAKLSDEYLTKAHSGEPYDVGNMPPPRMMQPFTNVILSFIVSIPIAWWVTSKKKKSLKSVGMQAKADQYIHPGSIDITKKSDTFLTEEVSKTRIVTTTSSSSSGGSSTSSSSSGRSHGGSSGKY